MRGAACYIGLLLLMQLAGKHVFGEMSPFDIVVPMLGVVALRSARAARETALPGPFIAVATILALDTLLATSVHAARV